MGQPQNYTCDQQQTISMALEHEYPCSLLSEYALIFISAWQVYSTYLTEYVSLANCQLSEREGFQLEPFVRGPHISWCFLNILYITLHDPRGQFVAYPKCQIQIQTFKLKSYLRAVISSDSLYNNLQTKVIYQDIEDINLQIHS